MDAAVALWERDEGSSQEKVSTSLSTFPGSFWWQLLVHLLLDCIIFSPILIKISKYVLTRFSSNMSSSFIWVCLYPESTQMAILRWPKSVSFSILSAIMGHPGSAYNYVSSLLHSSLWVSIKPKRDLYLFKITQIPQFSIGKRINSA